MATSESWYDQPPGSAGPGGYHSHHGDHHDGGGYRHAMASSSGGHEDANGLAGGHGGYIEDEREVVKHEHEHAYSLEDGLLESPAQGHAHGAGGGAGGGSGSAPSGGGGAGGSAAGAGHHSSSTPTSEPRVKRQVGRPRIETTKVPAEITDKLERTRALGRERQRRKRERDRQSAAMNSPGGYNASLTGGSEGFKRPRNGTPPSARADSPAQGNSRSLRSNKGYHHSPSTSSLSFEPLNSLVTTDGGYIESPVHHGKGGSGMLSSQRGARSGGGGGGFEQSGYRGGGNGGGALNYQVSPSRTAISTPSLDGPLVTRTPTELNIQTALDHLSPVLNPNLTGGAGGLGEGDLPIPQPSSHGLYFASNVIHALHVNRDLREITLRGLAMSETELMADAMRDEVAMAYDRFRAAQERAREVAAMHGQAVARYDDNGLGYVGNGLVGSGSNTDFPPRSAPASLTRSESWAGGGTHVASSPRHGHGRREAGGFGMRDRDDEYGLGSGPVDRPASAMAISQTPHLGMDMPPPPINHSYNQDDRVNGLNIHFGQHSSSRHSPKMGPPHDSSSHHYAWQRTPGESFNRGHAHSHSHTEAYDSNGNPSIVTTMNASPNLLAPTTPGTATLRPIRSLPGETSPYKARSDRSGIYEAGDGVGTAGAGGGPGPSGDGGYEGNGNAHDEGLMYPGGIPGGYTASPYLGSGQHADHGNHISSVMG